MGGTASEAPSLQKTTSASSAMPTSDAKQARSYTSHYLVFGTQDDAGRPRIVAIDFNRTAGVDSLAYEYKLFVAKDSNWSMPVYETWTTEKSSAAASTLPQDAFPSRGGLDPTLKKNVLHRVETNLPTLDLTVSVKDSAVPFSTGPDENVPRTGHPQVAVRWNDTTFHGPGVYEHIQSDGSGSNENAAGRDTHSKKTEKASERERRLDAESTFGLYDWIVLYDDTGRLWQVSQGTLTTDFAYQNATEALPQQTNDVLIRWTATAYDSTAGQHSPSAWLVDVPAWKMRVDLRKTGEHRGHGFPRSDGTRPIYIQAGVEGIGTINGQKHRFFGMVEHIRD